MSPPITPKMLGLAQLAAREDTPEHERVSAALLLAKAIVKACEGVNMSAEAKASPVPGAAPQSYAERVNAYRNRAADMTYDELVAEWRRREAEGLGRRSAEFKPKPTKVEDIFAGPETAAAVEDLERAMKSPEPWEPWDPGKNRRRRK